MNSNCRHGTKVLYVRGAYYGTYERLLLTMDDESLETSIAEHESYRHSSSRSQTAINDANAPTDNDGRSKTETHFRASDGDYKQIERFGYERNKWTWLNELQEGRYGHDNNERREPALAKRDLRTWMNQLECHDHQIEWGCQVYDNTSNNPDDKGYVGGRKHEGVLLAIITLVLNTDVSRKVRDEQQFQNIRESCDVSADTIKSVRKDIRHLL